MLAIIQEIGVIQSVIIAACLGFMLGMLVVIFGERMSRRKETIERVANLHVAIRHVYDDRPDEEKEGKIIDAYNQGSITIVTCDHRIPF